jgi:hypothetical protein
MTTPDKQKINSLRFALSQKLDAAATAQANLFAEQRRQGLALTPEFFTADAMAAVHAESRIELREMAKAVASDCRIKWLRGYVPTPLEKAMMGWPAAFAALDAGKQAQAAAPKADNVVSLVRQIAAAGRRRRGES